jgi:hypothetical protein
MEKGECVKRSHRCCRPCNCLEVVGPLFLLKPARFGACLILSQHSFEPNEPRKQYRANSYKDEPPGTRSRHLQPRGIGTYTPFDLNLLGLPDSCIRTFQEFFLLFRKFRTFVHWGLGSTSIQTRRRNNCYVVNSVAK